MALRLLHKGLRWKNSGSLCHSLVGLQKGPAASPFLSLGSLLYPGCGGRFHASSDASDASSASTGSREGRGLAKPLNAWKTLATETFLQGQRRYFIDLKQDELLNSYLKISEVTGERRNSIVLSIDDVKTFIDEFLKLIKDQENNSPEEGTPTLTEDKTAFVYCTFKKGKFFELRLAENKYGRYIRIFEQYFDTDNSDPLFKKKQIFVEAEGAEKLIRCIDQTYTRAKTA